MFARIGFVPAESRSVLRETGGAAFLAVIGIGAIAASGCDRFARDATQEKDISAMTRSVESFKEKYSALPPNSGSRQRLKRFVTKAFPSARAGQTLPEELDAAEALVFWLSRVSTDPKSPFEAAAKERHVFFEFPETRVRGGRFYPTVEKQSDPYVFFNIDDCGDCSFAGFRPYYRSDGVNKFYYEPAGFQIIGPGKDGKLGRGGLITELSDEDRDNVVSFANVLVGEIDTNE